MQIILLEKIANVGNLGDVVKVKDGYARNFLIPHGKAKRATPDNIKMLEAKRAELEAAANAKLVEAQAHAAKLEGLMVQITQKAGVDGRLFGSVTNADIAEALKGQGFVVEKASVRMTCLLHSRGSDVLILNHHDAIASLKTRVSWVSSAHLAPSSRVPCLPHCPADGAGGCLPVSVFVYPATLYQLLALDGCRAVRLGGGGGVECTLSRPR